ncbi:MAG: UDP-N-acetylmuramate--L-alanine ligase [Defluviitaleaceae bacterium]|nr:UDP-N-acetylmuramate--L-alanine ligase [Defluviitaleaceae bacterium]MCL2189776.1 UDP-N-acetylmuramate--L-alanine ligase [Defluviitaleaceae bacterium]MCL2275408.1 UDP-N-acetylmuramate--L-alanine ligase [Defluviitaleaceae bacterium]
MLHKIDLSTAKKVHFIGIGGISMCGLAKILQGDGYEVSGSDRSLSAATERLQAMGIKIYTPNAAENIQPDHDLVVYTAAINPDNPEYAAAKEKNIPMMGRAELLAAITKGYARTVCVAGSHGKTTTTALLGGVALAGGLDPTVHIGGYLSGELNNRVGETPFFILEACEYKNSFLKWHPFIGTILNVDADHIDFYGGMDGIIDSFKQFAHNIHPDGALIIHEETQGYDRIVSDLTCKVISFGVEPTADIYPGNITFTAEGKPTFDVLCKGAKLANIQLPLYGEYNIMNALAVFSVAQILGLTPDVIKKGLEEAQGVKRRFEHKGRFNGTKIIDDYAHHPTEIRASLAAARKAHAGRVVCLFQPHLYSRTRDLMNDFAQSFKDADIALFLPIYAAREAHDPTVTSNMLAEQVFANEGDNKKHVECFADFYTAEEWLRKNLTPGDLLLTMGAGDVHIVGERLL